MQQLLRYGNLPRSMVRLLGFVAGSSDQCFHTWGLRSSLIQVHSKFAFATPEMWQVFHDSGFASACSQRPLWESLIPTSPIAASAGRDDRFCQADCPGQGPATLGSTPGACGRCLSGSNPAPGSRRRPRRCGRPFTLPG